MNTKEFKRKYLHEKVNPIISRMVADTLSANPDNVVILLFNFPRLINFFQIAFMRGWLETKASTGIFPFKITNNN